MDNTGIRNTTEKQILSSLDQIHRELSSVVPCRWQYDGVQDVYSCTHLRLAGKEVIDRVHTFNRWAGSEDDGRGGASPEPGDSPADNE